MKTIFKKQSLKVSDKEKTRAAELTLRESIYPLCLVTILFFLWVRIAYFYRLRSKLNLSLGIFIRTLRYLEQAFPKHPSHHSSKVFWASGSLLWCLSPRFPRSCQLDSSPLRVQAGLHLGVNTLRSRSSDCVAMYFAPIVRWILRSNFHHWEWTWLTGNSCKSIHHWYVET